MNTAADFINYLEKRSIFLSQFENFSWNGEQELIAAYYMSLDEDGNHGFSYLERHGFKDIDGGIYDSKSYLEISKTERYRRKKKLEEPSFLVDHILESIHNRHGDRIFRDGDVERGLALMAATSRFERRMMAERIAKAFETFENRPVSNEPIFRSVSAGWVGQHRNRAKLFLVILIEVDTNESRSPDFYMPLLVGSAETYAVDFRRAKDLGPTNFAYLAIVENCDGRSSIFDIVIDLGSQEEFLINHLSDTERAEGLGVGFKKEFQTAFFEEFPKQDGRKTEG